MTQSTQMKPDISQIDLEQEFWTDERCHIIEISNSDNDHDVSIARARVEPGVTTAWHLLDGITERYYILAGEGIVEVGNMKPGAVRSGSTVIIPPNIRQRITNTGAEDLIFLAICSPRFKSEAYQELTEFETHED